MLLFFYKTKLILTSSGRRDLNPRLSAWEANTLPTELRPQIMNKLTISKLYDENKNFNEICCDFINTSVIKCSRY
jgi:hypothetical protein